MDKSQKNEIKEKIVHETCELLFLTVYLALFLNSLAIYRSLILGTEIFSAYHIGYHFIVALLLAKIIVLGKMLNLGNRYTDKSLIIPAVYRAMVFSLFVFVFSLLEHFVFGFFEGKELADVWKVLISQGINENLGKLLIAFLFFILLFSFLEICRVFGEEKVFRIFFRRDKNKPDF